MQTLTWPRLTMLPRSCVERSNCLSVMARIPPRLRDIKPIRLALTTPGRWREPFARSRLRGAVCEEPFAVEEAARLEVTSIVRSATGRIIMTAARKKTLVVRNGTLIDGSGRPAARNDAVVIEGNRIRSVGALPPDVELENRRA